jgi:hypothetical protein
MTRVGAIESDRTGAELDLGRAQMSGRGSPLPPPPEALRDLSTSTGRGPRGHEAVLVIQATKEDRSLGSFVWVSSWRAIFQSYFPELEAIQERRGSRVQPARLLRAARGRNEAERLDLTPALRTLQQEKWEVPPVDFVFNRVDPQRPSSAASAIGRSGLCNSLHCNK